MKKKEVRKMIEKEMEKFVENEDSMSRAGKQNDKNMDMDNDESRMDNKRDSRPMFDGRAGA
ncbi:MAG TPA: hypothetical protein V6C76_14970 [Drouetiella sp.]